MLISVRQELLDNDFSHNLKLLQHFPPVDVVTLISDAIAIFNLDTFGTPIPIDELEQQQQEQEQSSSNSTSNLLSGLGGKLRNSFRKIENQINTNMQQRRSIVYSSDSEQEQEPEQQVNAEIINAEVSTKKPILSRKTPVDAGHIVEL
eukprot:TRINITY_DN2509_c0_g1_i1.p1 TRINITY_DN2509_c0_g1~~TRINITY_DN2509_c0_g1_i1.p1  ORF type:complete len:170 (+),score=56.76 TRINITY_DN2509_c0_g1_i1:67-510(+)